jgi:hypothetical protein
MIIDYTLWRMKLKPVTKLQVKKTIENFNFSFGIYTDRTICIKKFGKKSSVILVTSSRSLKAGASTFPPERWGLPADKS